MKYIIIYWVVLFVYAVLMWRRNRSASSFLVHERKSGTFSVAMSLVALVFGASSVFGLAGYAHQYSFNAIWWTLSGVVFLIVLRYLFIGKLLALKAFTISDTVAAVFGPRFKIATSFIILVSWVLVLAGQIIAGGTIMNLLIGNRELSYILFCCIFLSYTIITGQSGTVRTSWIQTAFMLAGLIVLLVYSLSAYKGLPAHNASFNFGFGDTFTPMFFLNIFIPVGLSYLFGPDIYSRIFTARDEKSAGRGVLLACFFIVIFSTMIVAVGILGGQILGGSFKPDEIIPRLASAEFSGIAKSIVLIALISIPLSGADAMIANMGTFLGRDVVGGVYTLASGRNSEKYTVFFVRISMILISCAAVMTALNAKSIIPTLLIAYRVFSIVAVPLIMISMISLKTGVVWSSIRLKMFTSVYMFFSAAIVLLMESKIIIFSLQYIHLLLLASNCVVFLTMYFWMRRCIRQS